MKVVQALYGHCSIRIPLSHLHLLVPSAEKIIRSHTLYLQPQVSIQEPSALIEKRIRKTSFPPQTRPEEPICPICFQSFVDETAPMIRCWSNKVGRSRRLSKNRSLHTYPRLLRLFLCTACYKQKKLRQETRVRWKSDFWWIATRMVEACLKSSVFSSRHFIYIYTKSIPTYRLKTVGMPKTAPILVRKIRAVVYPDLQRDNLLSSWLLSYSVARYQECYKIFMDSRTRS